ncbi:MAG: lysophospholipase [Brumimicrobium sp.]|nr:lysophospholipase [Brumimicrobium sp.]
MAKLKLIILMLFYTILFNYSFALKPSADYVALPDTSLVNYEEHYINYEGTKDSIISWYFTPKNNANSLNKTIILSYGDYGNMSYFINNATILTQIGYNVITYDYRGFGHSSFMNLNSDFLYYEEFVEDLNKVIDYYSEKKTNQLILYGLSMGSYISLRACTDNISHNKKVSIDYLVMEGIMIKPQLIVEELKSLGKNTLIPSNSPNIDLKKLKKLKKLIFIGETDYMINKQFDEKTLGKFNWKIKHYSGGHLQGMESLTQNYYGDLYLTEIIKLTK